MKKYISAAIKGIALSLLLLAGAYEAKADVVDVTKATMAAGSWFNEGAVTKAGAVSPQLVYTGGSVTKGPYAPTFYVFNNPAGGWVIIAGEDSGRAVLGYSDEGSFDARNIPENLAGWLEGYSEEVEIARTGGLRQDGEAAEAWARLKEGKIRKATPLVNLNTAKWGQRSPYSNFCPTINGTRVVTGCVATAMSIVMRYYSHPAKGTGVIGGHTLNTAVDIYGTTAPTADLDADTGYDWANMPLTYGSSATAVQKDAVAKLMFHCGMAVQMKWNTGSSSASTRRTAEALLNNMKYSSQMTHEAQLSHTQGEWFNLLKGEFDARRPVIFAGRNPTTTSAHSFVGEGYDSDGNIRMNWGWGGDSNGFFAPTYFKTQPGDASSGDYRKKLWAITKIIPLEEGSSDEAAVRLYISGPFTMHTEIDWTQPNWPFLFSVGVGNAGFQAVSSSVRACLCAYDNTPHFAVTSPYPVSLNAGSYYSPDGFFDVWRWLGPNLGEYYQQNKKPAIGDKIMLFSRNADGTFSPVTITANPNGEDGIMLVNNSLPVYDIPFIEVKDGGLYFAGDTFDFMIANSRTVQNAMNAVWTFDGAAVTPDPVTKQASVILTAGEHVIKAVITIDGEEHRLTQKIRVL